ncbi:MAG: radical SAM protein, partial [Candidatus Omnitrophica bacterium]|nr:radical SAM protein [Candidatus Omnitrophota bacterium]
MTKQREVLLLFPPLNNIPTIGFYEPLIAEILSAIAKEEGCRTTLIDCRIEKKGIEKLAQTGLKPDLIGLGTHGYAEIRIVNDIAKRCRKLWPFSYIVVGGGQATLTPDFFDQTVINCIMKGPGEQLWRKLCKNDLDASSPCKIIFDEQVPAEYSFPLPDRESTRKYRKHYRNFDIARHRMAMTVTTQGCPFRCTFCCIWNASLGKYRERPIREVVEELKNIEEDYVYFGDDNTLADYPYSASLVSAIKAAGIHKTYIIYGRTDHIAAHPDIVHRWKEIGLRGIVIGVEAVTEEGLKRLNKKTTEDDNTKAVHALQEDGIIPVTHFIARPEFDENDFDGIYKFICNHKIKFPVVVPLTPLPGTEDYTNYKKAGAILTDDLDYYTFNYMIIKPSKLP